MCGSAQTFTEPQKYSKPQPLTYHKSSTETIVKPTKTKSTVRSTTSVREVLQAAVKKIQRSNTWTQGNDLIAKRDSIGKERHAFDARGAVTSVLAGKNSLEEMNETRKTKKYQTIERSLEKTLKAFNGEFGGYTKLTTFNDNAKHAQVVKLFNMTIERLS